MNIMKKTFLILPGVIIIAVLVLFVYVYTGFVQMEKGADAAFRTFDSSAQEGKASIVRRIEIQKRTKQDNIAWSYYQKGDYEMAIKEYKKAIEMSKYDQWAPRYRLSAAYEKAGYYRLAIQEIDWLLSHKLDKRVVDELTARKKNLTVLLN